MHMCCFCRLLGYEGLEVINPEGGQDDAQEEAKKGRWKQEVCLFFFLFFSNLCRVFKEELRVDMLVDLGALFDH